MKRSSLGPLKFKTTRLCVLRMSLPIITSVHRSGKNQKVKSFSKREFHECCKTARVDQPTAFVFIDFALCDGNVPPVV